MAFEGSLPHGKINHPPFMEVLDSWDGTYRVPHDTDDIQTLFLVAREFPRGRDVATG